jgi:alanine dehydrogenase
MNIGVPREIKAQEYRVALTPSGASEIVKAGHTVFIETGAGLGSGFPDEQYANAGARLTSKRELFSSSDLIVKVKEPIPEEYDLFREAQALFTYLHLAANPGLIDMLLDKKIMGFAYETLEDKNYLPLLAPMSEVAGRMAPQMGAFYLQKEHGGSGILPSGVPGVPSARCVVLGAGVVGTSALRIAFSLGMRVTAVNRSVERLREIDELFGGRVVTLPSTEFNIRKAVIDTDLAIGAVLVTGAKAPVLVTRDMVSSMRPGSVIVDVSVDQGGCIETTRPTTHDDPVYVEEGVLHYAVTNMPGAYPRTSTIALTNSTLPYIRTLASLGPAEAIRRSLPLSTALNTRDGCIAHRALADSVGRPSCTEAP